MSGAGTFPTEAKRRASAMTSVNSKRAPALFRKAIALGLIEAGARVLDFGCGRWPANAVRLLGSVGAKAQSYDPAWQPYPKRLKRAHYDVVCVSNVLNVIPDEDERARAVLAAWGCVRKGGRMIVTVYEADRSGSPGPTKRGWQERRPLADYVGRELAGIPGSVRNGMWVSDPKVVDAPPAACHNIISNHAKGGQQCHTTR